MKKGAALLIVVLAVSSSLVYAQSQTEEEVKQTIIESNHWSAVTGGAGTTQTALEN